ncbi:MAG: hypothetical protein EXR75_03345 [Myxococcales bacterium]|nr:hypothetical protein [Myxococcales bacterium]
MTTLHHAALRFGLSSVMAMTGGFANGAEAKVADLDATPTASSTASDDGGAGADLRYGHVTIEASAGPWWASSMLVPEAVGFGAPEIGGGAQLRFGVGVGRYLVSFLEGEVLHASAGEAGCDACSMTSIFVGLGVAAHLAQGFAVDPWISYGGGYRHILLAAADEPGAEGGAFSAFDFARIGIGLDYRPAPSWGIGPFAQSNLGVRQFADPVLYVDAVFGLRVTFDPMASHTKLGLVLGR